MLSTRHFVYVATLGNLLQVCLIRRITKIYKKIFLLASPILRSETLPGADDLFDSQSSSGGSPVLLVLILRLYGVNATLWRNIHFNLEETVQKGFDQTRVQGVLTSWIESSHLKKMNRLLLIY